MAPNIQRHNILYALLISLVVLAIGITAWMLMIKPSIRMTSDALGSTRGGRQFVISGSNFMLVGRTRVLVGGIDSPRVQVQSPSSIVATAPAGSDGVVSVTVINPNGQRANLNDAYQYSSIKPEIDSVTPKVLPAQGGVVVTVKGHGFTATPVQVHFHEEVLVANVIDNNTLTFVAPKAPAAVPTNVNVEIATPDEAWSSDEFNINYR